MRVFSRAINNSRFTAYNKGVELITITEKSNPSYIPYLYGKVSERFSFLPADYSLETDEERTKLTMKAEKKYCPYIRKYAEENIAEVIAVGYKYAFFKRNLALPNLTEDEKEILLSSLVAADFSEDVDLIRAKLSSDSEYCIDGTYNFRLVDLKERWKKICEYIPPEFNADSLQSFVEFLVDDGEKKVFLKEGVLYDEEYRPLGRSQLVGEPSQVKEILLAGANSVYCFGEVEKSVREFLEKFYKEKVIFC